MALPKSFTPFQIKDKLAETGLRGKNFEFLTDYTRESSSRAFSRPGRCWSPIGGPS